MAAQKSKKSNDKPSKQQERFERLAAELRANLTRRKEQLRARAAESTHPASERVRQTGENER